MLAQKYLLFLLSNYLKYYYRMKVKHNVVMLTNLFSLFFLFQDGRVCHVCHLIDHVTVSIPGYPVLEKKQRTLLTRPLTEGCVTFFK